MKNEVLNSTWWFSLISQLFSVVLVIGIIYFIVKLYNKLIKFLDKKPNK